MVLHAVLLLTATSRRVLASLLQRCGRSSGRLVARPVAQGAEEVLEAHYSGIVQGRDYVPGAPRLHWLYYPVRPEPPARPSSAVVEPSGVLGG